MDDLGPLLSFANCYQTTTPTIPVDESNNLSCTPLLLGLDKTNTVFGSDYFIELGNSYEVDNFTVPSNSSRSSLSRTPPPSCNSGSGTPKKETTSYVDILKTTKSTTRQSEPEKCTFTIAGDVVRERKSNSYQNEKMKVPSKFKTVLCSKFTEQGRCPYGASCLYAHGKHELGPASSTLKSKDQNKLFRTKLCRVFEDKGSCPYGSSCVYAHGIHELKDSTADNVTILKRK